MFKIWNNSLSQWKILVSREQIVHYLETVQDLIVILLCIGLFSIMLIRMGELFFSLMHPLQFQAITSDILFLLILVELFRLLIIYLQERRISVGVAVEVSIVSTLREVILRGVVEIPNTQLWAICGFLVVLGGLLLVRTIQGRIFKTIGFSEKNLHL
ncbi:MAG: phosphate-starvation-inducible PsiE family protein [Chlorogloeopsis fritschii C42_A2020_084]|uniref:phosphate-starvation-inducible PsiE family protein n=1 Tax=Chlorogloeopsis fritschii TaxID=1124 RepID=UPI0019DFA156|nr:phosphate-starvation-inducible PsiE family protein [Chlorogloeopsis fritschii]MBF2008249.1 phosphate-starvation-inducible PsiE family protein [Chlorogloeopsis fritschii C42_A2020_084]